MIFALRHSFSAAGLVISILGTISAPEEAYLSAERAFDAGDIAGAAHLYGDFLDAYPESPLVPGALMGRAWCFIRMGEYQDALSAVEDIESRFGADPFPDLILYTRGVAEYRLGRSDGARSDLTSLLSDYPSSSLAPDARYHLALLDLSRHDYSSAESALSALLSPDLSMERRLEIVGARAAARTGIGEIDGAISDWREVISLAGEDGAETAYIQIALLLERAGRNSAPAFERYLHLYPSGAYAVRAHAALGEYNKEIDPALAAEHYGAVLSLAPRSTYAEDAISFLGFRAYDIGDDEAAEELLSRLVRDYPFNPDLPLALEILGRIASAEGRRDLASDRYAQLALAAPENRHRVSPPPISAQPLLPVGEEVRPAEEALASGIAVYQEGDAEHAEELLELAAEAGEREVRRGALEWLVRVRADLADMEGVEKAMAQLDEEFPGTLTEEDRAFWNAALSIARPEGEVGSGGEGEGEGEIETWAGSESVRTGEEGRISPGPKPLLAGPPLRVAVVQAYHSTSPGVVSPNETASSVIDLVRESIPRTGEFVVLSAEESSRFAPIVNIASDLSPEEAGAEVIIVAEPMAGYDSLILNIDFVWIGRYSPRAARFSSSIPFVSSGEAISELGERIAEAIRIEAGM